ncbi:MAG: HTH domain-containing protein, partial [Clostridiales bacterium]|nr:HTH domain-containing protein [Clostridiales bacterium]
MSTAYNVLRFLENNKGKFISGGEIASNLGVSRNAVWKAVNTLKSEGFDITAVTNKGYMLSEKDKSVSTQSIEKYIKDDKIRVDYRPSVTSTNTILKELGAQGQKEGLLQVSSEQTAG